MHVPRPIGGDHDCSRMGGDAKLGPSSSNRAEKTTLDAIFRGAKCREMREKLGVDVFRGVAGRRSKLPLMGSPSWGVLLLVGTIEIFVSQ